MRTIVRLDDALLERAKREAARRQITLAALIEQGLKLAMSRSVARGTANKVSLPVCRRGGGILPGADLGDSSALLDGMEGRNRPARP